MARPRRPPLGRVRDAALTRVEYARREGRGVAEKRVVAVLGMHRSGTSAVAGCLQAAGLYMGNVLRKHESNRKGTRELLKIVALHDEILAYSGGSWRHPPVEAMWNDDHRARRDAIVASFSGAELWGFKDPRTLLLLEFWREALGGALRFVGVFREPGAVVDSLLSRDGGSPDEWYALWTRYNGELLCEHDAARFPLVEFTPRRQRFDEQIGRALRGLALPADKGARFFEPDLPSASGSSVPVPAETARLYERLKSAS